MPILKTSPNELAIHGGGPPAFASRVPAFSAHAGDGRRFAELAESMFSATQPPGRLVEQFENLICDWLGVRNVIGFSSMAAAVKTLVRAHRGERWYVPAFGQSVFPVQGHPVEAEPASFGLSPSALAQAIGEDTAGVFGVHALGRPCLATSLEDICDEWNVPLFLLGHQALGTSTDGELLGGLGRAEIFELSRDQLVHAMDAAIICSNDDLLAHRLRSARLLRPDGIDQGMSDAAAAMGIANLESIPFFLQANATVYQAYAERLSNIPGIRLLRHVEGGTRQSIALEVNPGDAGLTRDSLYDVLVSENVGVAKPFEGYAVSTSSLASKIASSLLQLPAGPIATEAVIEAVCKLVELAIVRSLESPDPIGLAA